MSVEAKALDSSPLMRALKQAGLQDVFAEVDSGRSLSSAHMRQIENADVLLLGGLANRLREKTFGDDVWLVTAAYPSREIKWIEVGAKERTGLVGLRELALARLQTPTTVAIGVSWDETGIELAQVALAFGVSALRGTLPSSIEKALPVSGQTADSKEKVQQEISALIRRASRNPVWVSEQRNDHELHRQDSRQSS